MFFNSKTIFSLLFLTCFLIGSHSNAQTIVTKINDEWTLLVDGQPFEVKGVTFGYDKEPENFERHMDDLIFLGVNTIRIWATNEHTQKLLDVAHDNGIKVMVGIWMRHGHPGMEDDDSFDYLRDTTGMEAMYADAVETVGKYKDHPAVLTWAVGNEVYLNTATDEEKEAYSMLLERICREIKKIDVNHPVTSVEAWTFGLDWWQELVPSIDIYGLNSYGPGAGYLSAELEKRGIDKPYVITEFGMTGEWDIEAKRNGIALEPSDREKYDAISIGYRDWIQNKHNCLGVYVFHYANGSDFVSPWLFTHHNQMTRPQYWAIREAYTGQEPVNHVPVIESFQLPDAVINSRAWIPVTLEASDIEREELEISFHYNQRTGSRKRRDQINNLNFRGNLTNGFEIQLPREDGPIKVYVNVKDTYNNVGIASTSIVVTDKDARDRKFLVPRADLPFYVYQNGDDGMPYIPSAHMGNYTAMDVDLNSTDDVWSGSSSIMISYHDREDWYGLGFVDPVNDWGDILGGYDICGAKQLSFRAKSSESGLKATVGFGLIDDDKPFPDTGKRSEGITLTNEWKQYTIKTGKADLSCIRSGFVIFVSGNGFPHKIYLDDIIFK